MLLKERKNKLAKAILSFFLGDFGAHRFYLGQNDSGFKYLLFCWTTVPALIGIIDAFNILTMDEEEFHRTYY